MLDLKRPSCHSRGGQGEPAEREGDDVPAEPVFETDPPDDAADAADEEADEPAGLHDADAVELLLRAGRVQAAIALLTEERLAARTAR